MTHGDFLLEVDDLHVWFPARGRRHVKAVNGVSLTLAGAETLGLIGESGSGKSTLGRALVGLERESGGEVRLSGQNRKRRSSRVQMVFQDSTASLNPRMSALESVREPLDIARGLSLKERNKRALGMLEDVGLDSSHGRRYPHELSGGQKQRVNIARALITEPELVVCDESVSALDVSMQADILNLFQRLQDRTGVAYLFITHDLSVVARVSDRIAVMYLGQIMEIGAADRIIDTPSHPYTEALISAQPRFSEDERPDRIVLNGEIPSPLDVPPGCAFQTRCPYVRERCRTERPALVELADGHRTACHFATELSLQGATPLATQSSQVEQTPQ